MMRFISFIFCLSLFSCGELFQKEEHTFIYALENQKHISSRQFNVTINVLKKRLNGFGLKNEINRFEGNKVKVSVWSNELDKDRVNRLLLNRGKLEFWEVRKGVDFFTFLTELNSNLVNEKETDSTKMNPLLDLIAAPGYNGGPVICQFKTKDTATVNTMLNKNEVKFMLPSEYIYTKFLWEKLMMGSIRYMLRVQIEKIKHHLQEML